MGLRLMQQKEFNLTSWVAKWKWSSHSKQKWQAFATNFGCWAIGVAGGYG